MHHSIVSLATQTASKMENLKKHLFSSRSTGNDSRSVFHVKADGNEALSQEVRDCCESIEEFHNAVRNLVGAGTHLTETLTKALKDSSYESIGDEFAATFREVYACSQMSRWAQQMKEMGALLLKLKEMMDENRTDDDLGKLPAQTYCHVLMLFLRMQKSYHHYCDKKLDALATKLCDVQGIDGQREVTKQLLTTVVSNEAIRSDSRSDSNSPSNSPRTSPKRKTDDGVVSPKTQRSFRSSLLSLFERKQSPDDGKSAFYVDVKTDVAGCITQDGTPQAAGSPSRNIIGPSRNSGSLQPYDTNLPTIKTAEMTSAESSTTDSTPSSATGSGCVDLLGLGPVTAGSAVPLIGAESAAFQAFNVPSGATGDFYTAGLASEEELESVINLLSGVNTETYPGLASEEELESVINLLSGVNTTNSPMQVIPEHLAVPPIYRMPSPASDSHIEEMNAPRVQHHRRSEGCLDLSGMSRSTWPHRASLPTVQPFTHRQFAEQQRDASVLMRQPLPEMYHPNAGYVLPGAVTSQSHGAQYGYPVNGGWQNKSGSETMTSGWSGLQDTSDLSDDSSSGEQFYAMGRDLVQAIETKDDSSEDEFDKDERKLQSCSHAGGLELQNNRSNNTWPPKPCTRSNQFLSSDVSLLEPIEDPSHTHRPVQMQWSDPLSTRSMWPTIAPGFSPQRTSQSMQGFGNLQ